MEKGNRLSDIDYCYVSWKLLKDLEKCAFERNESIRKFREKADGRQSIIIGAISMILPLILWGFILGSEKGGKALLSVGDNLTNFGTRLGGLLMVSAFLFIIVFMLLKTFWNSQLVRPLRNLGEKRLKHEFLKEVNGIDEGAKQIVFSKTFEEARIPDNYYTGEILMLLIRFFETGQATIMKEAVYYLNLELKNTGHYANILPQETLLQKEKEYFSNREENLEKKIEEGERK